MMDEMTKQKKNLGHVVKLQNSSIYNNGLTFICQTTIVNFLCIAYLQKAVKGVNSKQLIIDVALTPSDKQ